MVIAPRTAAAYAMDPGLQQIV
ncbi:protein of unknown function [Streptantibioticus cattleyicolor NRRL 8057 = DSM 46488]|nr:protein of unknown function [Streptantibioticus cattleyicolor NRRL 8057 = DSM 46488]